MTIWYNAQHVSTLLLAEEYARHLAEAMCVNDETPVDR